MGNTLTPPLKMREQIVSGSAGGKCGLISQTYWATLTPPGGPDGYWQYDIPIEGCDNWVAELSGRCKNIDKNLKAYRVSGDIRCKYEHHEYRAPLFKSEYSGLMWASGEVPFKEGRADWTNQGSHIFHYQTKDEQNNLTWRAGAMTTEQEYFVHYPDASGLDVALESTLAGGQKGPAISQTERDTQNALYKAKLQHAGQEAVDTDKEKDKLNSATRAKWIGATTIDERDVRVQYNIERSILGGELAGDGTEAGQRMTKAGDIVDDKIKNSKGDLVWMGGWPLTNTSWPSELIQQDNASPDAKAKKGIYGKNVVIYITDKRVLDPKMKLPALTSKKGGYGLAGTKTASIKSTPWNFETTINGVTYKAPGTRTTSNFISAIYSSEKAYNKHLETIQGTANVRVTDYGAGKIKLTNRKAGALSRPFTYDCFYTVTEGELAACDHCLAEQIPMDDIEGFAEERRIFFGEQMFVGLKTEWEMRSGNFHFSVPYVTQTRTVTNPTNPSGPPVTMRPWNEYVTYVSHKYDPALARTGYAYAGNSYNNAQPPGIPCNMYSKYGRIQDFTVHNDRRWAEIPRGGIIEGINLGVNDPLWAGPIDGGVGLGGSYWGGSGDNRGWKGCGYDSYHYIAGGKGKTNKDRWASQIRGDIDGKTTETGQAYGYQTNTNWNAQLNMTAMENNRRAGTRVIKPGTLHGGAACCDLAGGGVFGNTEAAVAKGTHGQNPYSLGPVYGDWSARGWCVK